MYNGILTSIDLEETIICFKICVFKLLRVDMKMQEEDRTMILLSSLSNHRVHWCLHFFKERTHQP